jgi:hypothetical protein
MAEKPLYLSMVMLILAVIIVGAIVFFPIFNNNINKQITKEGIKYHGEVCFWVNDKLIGCNHNLITNTGKDIVYYALTGTTKNVNQIAVANNTVPQSASDTYLQGEWTRCGLVRGAADTIVKNNYGNWTLSKLWTITCDNVIINATGLYTSDNELFAETTLPTYTLYTSDQLRISWTIWVS